MRRFMGRFSGFLVGFIILLLALILFGSVLFILSLQASYCVTKTINEAPTAVVKTGTLPVPAGTVIASPSPTATPPLTDKITTCTDNTNKALTSLLLVLVNLFATMVVITLALFLIWRLWRLSRMSNLVIETFNNATGNDDLDKALPGLNQQAREKLVSVIDNVRQRILKYRDQGPGEYDPSDKSPPPATNTDQRLTDLLTSLKDVAPPGPLQTSVQLLSLVFKPGGTKVSITLQKKGDTPQIFGISLEVTDLQGQQEPKLLTLWEPSHPSNTANKPQQDATSSPPSSLHKLISLFKTFQLRRSKKQVLNVTKTPEDHFLTLIGPAMRWLAIELARRSMEAQAPRIGRRKNKSYYSRMHNFIGDFYQSSAFTFYDYPDFYKLAINNFKQAIEEDEDWFQPHENLADTYVSQVIGIRSKPVIDDKVLVYQAISQYDKAWEVYIRKKQKNTTIMRRLAIGKATAQLLTNNNSLITEARVIIALLLSNWEVNNETSWEVNNEKDGLILYNLAAWYGIAQSTPSSGVQDAKLLSRRYLLYSLVRDDSFWYSAERDSSFVDIFTVDEFEALKTVISKKVCEVPELGKKCGNDFQQDIDWILLAVSLMGFTFLERIGQHS